MHNIDGILAPFTTPLTVMEGSYAHNQDTADFILAGSGDQPRLTANALNIGMTWVLMAYRYNLGSRFAQGIAQIR